MSDQEYIQQLEAALADAVNALIDIEFGDSGGLDGPGYCSACGWRDPHHAVDCKVQVAKIRAADLLFHRGGRNV